MALVNCVSSPADIGKAASLLRTLQEAIEEAVGGAGACAQGTALNEGQYLLLCELTGGIHEVLHAAQSGCAGAAPVGRRRARPTGATAYNYVDYHDDDDGDDLAGGDWTIRRVRRMPGGTIVVTERAATSGLGSVNWTPSMW